MKTGLNAADQKRLFDLKKANVPIEKIAEILRVKKEVVVSFLKAGKTNAQLAKDRDRELAAEAEE